LEKKASFADSGSCIVQSKDCSQQGKGCPAVQRTASQDELATLAWRICRRHKQRPELTAAWWVAMAELLEAAERFFAAAADAAADL
jgi:hypothetical protein